MKNSINFFVLVIIISGTMLAISSSVGDSLIVDEVPHIGAGFSYVTKHDMRLNPEHPPLVKDLAGLFLLPLHLDTNAFNTKFWNEDNNGQWEFGRKLIYNSGNNADAITFFARLPMLIFYILGAMMVFIWSKERRGIIAGIIALILFIFSPNIMAHGRFVTTDVPALFGILISTYFFIRYLKTPTNKTMFISSIFLGIALLTKFSTFLLIPYFLLLSIIYYWLHGLNVRESLRQIGRTIILITLSFIIVVWPIYFLNSYNYPSEKQGADTTQILKSYNVTIISKIINITTDIPILRSLSLYGLGLVMAGERAAGGNTTYFLGEVSNTSWKSYFPIVYLIKEPLPWLLLLLSVIIIALKRLPSAFQRDKAIANFDEYALLLWIFIYWTVSITSNLNIGIRHLLPIYGFSIILVGGEIGKALSYVKQKNIPRFQVITASVAVLLGWYVFENLNVHPYYLSYFNQLAGGPAGGYHYVTDSNLDWGQDLKRLSSWINGNKLNKIELDYFGWADPTYYLKDRYIWISSSKYKDKNDFIKNNNSNGWLAISVNFFQQSLASEETPNYRWLKNIQPETSIGNSIFVFHITE